MTCRILIPTKEQEGIAVAYHFGRAPYFSVIDLDTNGAVIERSVHPNRSEHAGGKGHAHSNVLQFHPNVVIVRGMGPRGIRSFEDQNIIVLGANSDSVDEVVNAYIGRELEALTNGCADARHK